MRRRLQLTRGQLSAALAWRISVTLFCLSGLPLARSDVAGDAPAVVGDPLQPRLPAIVGRDLPRRAWITAVGASGERLLAVGAYGVVLLSEDQGRSWRQVVVPTDVTLTSIFLREDGVGWIGGHESTLLETRDGGNTWTMLITDPRVEDPILRIWVSDLHGGFAIGGRGLFFRANMVGGRYHWRRSEFNVLNDDLFSPHLFDISQTGDGTLLVAGEAGHLYRSIDGGDRWTLLEAPYHGSLFGLLPVRDGWTVLYGMLGHVFATADSGETWGRVDAPVSDSLIADAEAPALLAGTNGSVIALDVRRGEVRAEMISAPVGRRAITGMLPLQNGTILAATNRGLTRFELSNPDRIAIEN